MKNILLVLPWFPYPKISGGHQAIFNGIKAIATYMNVSIAFQGLSNQDLENSFLREIGTLVKIFPYSEVREERGFFHSVHVFLWRIKLLLFRLLKKERANNTTSLDNWIKVFYPLSEGYLKYINTIIASEKIDIVQCEMLGNLSLVLSLPNNVEKIFVHHEIGYVKNELSLLGHSFSLNADAYLGISKLIEIELLNKYDKIITLSEIDKEKLIGAGINRPIYSSFAVVETQGIENPVSDEYSTLTFVGPEFHTPNYEGLLWFLENCWDTLKEKDNNYKLKIIGNWTKETISVICSKYHGLEFLGYVDNLAEALSGSIMIVPITIGSGIRMKILEAASIGIPFVSTSVGAEGLPMENSKDCYIADISSDFVNAILNLKNKDIRLLFSRNAKMKVEDLYSISELAKNRISIYSSNLHQ